MTDKLKPCPFCGEANRIHIRKQGNHAYRVICHACGALGPYAKVEEWHKDKFIAQGQAKKLWNTRCKTMTNRDRLIELCNQKISTMKFNNSDHWFDFNERISEIADHLLSNGVIVPPCKVGDEIWVIDREDGEAVDISCVMFLAKSKGCIIATSWINDYELDETLEYHINETQENFDTDLKVYPDEDCFLTKEEAEKALKALKEREGNV